PAELLGAQRAAVVRLQVLAVARLARIEDAVAADLQPADLAAPVAVPAVAVVALLRVVEVAVPADGGATAPEEGAPEEHREGERRPGPAERRLRRHASYLLGPPTRRGSLNSEAASPRACSRRCSRGARRCPRRGRAVSRRSAA